MLFATDSLLPLQAPAAPRDAADIIEEAKAVSKE